MANETGTFAEERLFVEDLSGDVSVALAKQHPAECHPLSRRPQTHVAQHGFDVAPRTPCQAGSRAGAPPPFSTLLVRRTLCGSMERVNPCLDAMRTILLHL